MKKVCTVAGPLSVHEMDQRLHGARAGWRARRWMLIRQAVVDPQPAGVLASRFGLSPQTVRNLLSAYRQRGAAGIETPGRGQRQRAYLSLEEEQQLLQEFRQASHAGQMSTAQEIKAALESAVGHPVAKSTVYRLLQRHQWRKVTPRPAHPKANPEQQQAFKKTLLSR